MSALHIQDWLNSQRSYDVGADLYLKYGSNPVKAAFFFRGESTLRRELLIAELISLQEKLAVVLESERKPEEQILKVITSDAVFDSFPDFMQAKVVRVKELYARGGALKSKLLLIPEKLERGIVANTIRDIDEEATELLCEIDCFKSTGKLPIADPVKRIVGEMSLEELHAEKYRLRPKITRWKDKPEKAAVVAEMQHLLDLIEYRLNNDVV